MADRVGRSGSVPLVAFAAGGVLSLLLGVYGKEHHPSGKVISTLGFDSLIQMKVLLATVVGILALGQLVGALALYGRLPVKPPAWLGTAHRATGMLAILLSLPVAYHCLWSLGFQSGGTTPARVVIHSVAGCAVYGALVVKVVAVRSRSAPGWLLPVAGGLLFAAIVAVVWTSSIWYFGAHGWPHDNIF
jgi:hypothetical protein